jgi:hypothetical protein
VIVADELDIPVTPAELVVVVVVVIAGVANPSLVPYSVPAPLPALTLKTYATPGVSPSTLASTPTGLVPDPTAGEQGTDFV